MLPNPEPTNLTPFSIKSLPPLKLKTLPKHLKYIYLDGQNTLSVIIASHLTAGQEESLMSVLRKHREAIGWTITNIKGLSPAIVQHRIHPNEEATS